MPGTINRELAVLRAALMLGARHTRPKVDRVPYISQLRGNNPRQGFFEHEAYGAVLAQLPEYLRPVVTFAYHTGWRKEEVLSLTSAQVDRMQGTVRLNQGMRKNREGRTVYLDDEVKGVIEDLEAAHHLPQAPPGHKCRRLHGHSFRVEIAVEGEVAPVTGWFLDYGVIREYVEPIRLQLDHYCLNDIAGLENPTSEHLARWIWERLKPSLPSLARITVHETCESRCEYDGL